MTELSFLLDLLLNHKLPKATREAVTARIKDVEVRLSSAPAPAPFRTTPVTAPAFQLPPNMSQQSASTMAALARQAAEQNASPIMPTPEPQPAPPEPTPPAIIAQTGATMAAMAARNEAIMIAASGKPERGRTSPRKF